MSDVKNHKIWKFRKDSIEINPYILLIISQILKKMKIVKTLSASTYNISQIVKWQHNIRSHFKK